jgi:hypothetical protein
MIKAILGFGYIFLFVALLAKAIVLAANNSTETTTLILYAIIWHLIASSYRMIDGQNSQAQSTTQESELQLK